METSKCPDSPGFRWWETPGSLRTDLLRLDGEVGTAVEAGKQVVEPTAVSDDLARHLGRLVQQMGLSAGDGMVEKSDREFGFEPLKPGFTREAGSFRRQGSPQRIRELGE